MPGDGPKDEKGDNGKAKLKRTSPSEAAEMRNGAAAPAEDPPPKLNRPEKTAPVGDPPGDEATDEADN